jgi:L-fuconolactonase
MPAFPIVDSHVHLYDVERLSYGWMASAPKINRSHGMAEFDAARGPVVVDKLVFVEVAADAGLHLKEAAFVQELADRDARIAGIVAHAPVEKGDAVEDDVAALKGTRSLVGIRRLIQGEPDPSVCIAPNFLAGVRRLGRHGLTFDICVKSWQMAYAVELVRRCPDVRFVLDHIGKPDIRNGMMEPWRSQIQDLARLPNVVCKVSGVITEADHASWTPAGVTPYVNHVIDSFGFDRVLFGSDWTVSELTHRYPDWVSILDGVVGGASETEQRAFWRETAIRTYGLAGR